jgi:hypothetical protein
MMFDLPQTLLRSLSAWQEFSETRGQAALVRLPELMIDPIGFDISLLEYVADAKRQYETSLRQGAAEIVERLYHLEQNRFEDYAVLTSMDASPAVVDFMRSGVLQDLLEDRRGGSYCLERPYLVVWCGNAAASATKRTITLEADLRHADVEVSVCPFLDHTVERALAHYKEVDSAKECP